MEKDHLLKGQAVPRCVFKLMVRFFHTLLKKFSYLIYGLKKVKLAFIDLAFL